LAPWALGSQLADESSALAEMDVKAAATVRNKNKCLKDNMHRIILTPCIRDCYLNQHTPENQVDHSLQGLVSALSSNNQAYQLT
jgi:hypothetical protein